MKNEVLHKKHAYWRAVYVRLNDALVENGCDHSFDHTEQILFSLPEIDVGGTLDFFMENGGYCDCEILFNVFQDEPKLKKAE